MRALQLSYLDRLPFERAIDIIEALPLEEGVEREDLIHHAKAKAGDDIVWWVDHTLRILRHHGYVKRIHIDVDHILYFPTTSWPCRDELLQGLRSPPKKNRNARDLKRKLARQDRERSSGRYTLA